MNDVTAPAGELFVTHFLVVSDQDRSRDFYRSVFGAEVVRDRDPVILALANTRIVLNVGGGPTGDKPTVRLASPRRPGRLQRVPEPPSPGHRQRVPGLVGEGRRLPHRAKRPRARDPRLHPRSGRSSHRGRPDHVNGADPGRIRIEPVRPEWADASSQSDAEFTKRFGVPVEAGWAGFPEALSIITAAAQGTNPVNGDRTCSSATTEH